MRRTIVAVALFAAIACSSETNPTSPVQAADLKLGKAVAPAVPRALISFSDLVNVAGPGEPEDWRAAGITGDGRLRDGVTASGQPSNEYLGNACGVSANIENGARQGGDLDFDPDLNYSATTGCGAARYYNFYLAGGEGTPTAVSPHARVFGIWALAVGESVNKGQGFGVRLANCTLLMFNGQYGGDDLKVVRVDDGTGPRRWTVSSQGAHIAACVVQGKKGAATYTATGVKYFLPVSFNVTEVP